MKRQDPFLFFHARWFLFRSIALAHPKIGRADLPGREPPRASTTAVHSPWSCFVALVVVSLTMMLVLCERSVAQVVRFARTTDTIRVPLQTTLIDKATFEARIKVPVTGTPFGLIYHEQVNAAEEKQLGVSGGGAVGLAWTSTAYQYRQNYPGTPHTLNDGLWHHIAFVRDGVEERFYLDGTRVYSAAWSELIANSSASGPIAIGASQFSYYRGAPLISVDWLRLSNVARYAGDVAPPPVCEPVSDASTLALFLFNDPPGSTSVVDSGPSRAHGTVATGFAGATSPVFESDSSQNGLPSFTQASAEVICEMGAATFSLAAVGPGPFTYQWRKGGIPIDTAANPSAATDTLLLNSVQASDAGLYDCIVSNDCGSATSDAADLNVYCNCPPYTQLAGVIDSPGFSLPADPAFPSGSLGAALNNENPRPLLDFDQIPGTTPGVTGDRSVAHTFTNIPSDLVSASLRFRVRSGPDVNAAGEGTDLMRLGFAQGIGNAANFSGSNPTRLYWSRYFGVGNTTDAYFAGTVWGGGIDRSITLNLAALPNASQQGGGTTNLLSEMATRGTLDLVVADDSGVDFAELTGVRAGGPTVAWVRTHPQNIPIACPSSPANFTVTPAGTAPFTFQWRKNQTPIDASANPTAATATLNLANIGPADAAEYDCLITNSCSSVTSKAATLAICAADFNCDGFITYEDFDSFVSAFEGGSPSADFNADGFLTFEDFDAIVADFETGC